MSELYIFYNVPAEMVHRMAIGSPSKVYAEDLDEAKTYEKYFGDIGFKTHLVDLEGNFEQEG